MELSDYLRLTREFEELIQSEPAHLRLGKTLEFVRDNFVPHEIWDIYSDSLLNTTAKQVTPEKMCDWPICDCALGDCKLGLACDSRSNY